MEAAKLRLQAKKNRVAARAAEAQAAAGSKIDAKKAIAESLKLRNEAKK
jgi:hypothetical protein